MVVIDGDWLEILRVTLSHAVAAWLALVGGAKAGQCSFGEHVASAASQVAGLLTARLSWVGIREEEEKEEEEEVELFEALLLWYDKVFRIKISIYLGRYCEFYITQLFMGIARFKQHK